MRVFLFYLACCLLRAWYKIKPFLQAFYPSFELHYAVKPDGRQRLLFGRLAADDLLLIVRYKNGKKQFKFCEDADLEFVVPKHGIIGLNAVLDCKVVLLDPHCFMVVGNLLFSPIFNLWLSRRYSCEPTTCITFTYIDHNAEIRTCTKPMRVLDNGVYID